MIVKIFFQLILVVALTSCNNEQQFNEKPDEILYAWMHDIGFKGPNFLAVINADSKSNEYGHLIDTIPVNETIGMAHHTPIFLPRSGMIYANDFHNSQTYIYDTADPLKPDLINSFGKIEKFSFPHSYSELPNGNIISTFQTKGGIDTIGGLVEFDFKGNFIRSSDAEPEDKSIFVRPYGIVLAPKLNKLVTTNYDMHETGHGYHIQVWNMSSLKLEHTLKLPHTEGMIIDQNPFEGRLLEDDNTIMIQTFSCGLYVLDKLDSNKPIITKVHHFAKEPFCSLPVRLNNYWIQTVASDKGGFNGLIVLDISDPYFPIEVDRLNTGESLGPHWISPNKDGNKIVLTGFFKELERRVMMLSFNKSNGNISIDESFGKGDSFGSGLIIDRKEWPHGEEGAAMAHGAIFWPAARPDWD